MLNRLFHLTGIYNPALRDVINMLANLRTRPTPVTVNYFKFKQQGDMNKYQISAEPAFDLQDDELYKGILRLCTRPLKEKIARFSYGSNLQLYSPEEIDTFEFVVKRLSEEGEEGSEYTMTVKKVGKIDVNAPEHVNVLGRFFKSLQGSLRL